jgi:hypothetical protein
MGKGSRPAKAKNLVLVPGVADDVVEKATAVAAAKFPGRHAPPVSVVMDAVAELAQEAEGGMAAVDEATPVTSSPGPEATTVPEEPTAPVEPSLADLQALKEEIRKQHPTWYPEYRDSLGHQFNEQLVPEFAGRTAAELGLPANADADRVRREVRALAFARSYLMAKAGDADGLKSISPDLLYFWDDRVGGLVPELVVSPDDPAPWVHSINRLRSRQTAKMDAEHGNHPRFRRFVKAVKGWTNGRWKELRAAAQRVLTGEAKTGAEREARELIEAIRAADNGAPRLWRKESARSVAERMGVGRDALLSHLQTKVGQEVTQDIVSTSSRPDIWSGDFVWEVEPGAQAIHAYPISHYPSESEWITAGSFRVLAAEPYGSGGVKVRVQQTGVFEVKE